MRSQRTTVDHNETLNKLSRTQHLPRTKAKPRPRTHSVFLNTRVCCTCMLRFCMIRVFVCAVFGLIRSRGTDRAVSSKARRQQRVSSHDRFAEAMHRVEDTVPPPVEPSGHSRSTDPERCWLGFCEQLQNLGRLQAAQEKLQSELNTLDHGFLVTDANDIRKNVAPELLSPQLENFLAKRPLVESLGSVMGTLVNMKRASM